MNVIQQKQHLNLFQSSVLIIFWLKENQQLLNVI